MRLLNLLDKAPWLVLFIFLCDRLAPMAPDVLDNDNSDATGPWRANAGAGNPW
jgi:hypothetical protein